jgi:hypothetical protein
MYQETNPSKTTLQKNPPFPSLNYNNIPTIPKKKSAADGMQLIFLKNKKRKKKKAGREPEKTTCRKKKAKLQNITINIKFETK